MKTFFAKQSSAQKIRPVAILAIAGLFFPVVFSAGCGGNALSSLGNPPPVSAQQNYSNASLKGAYSINEIGSTNGQLHDGSGSLQFDGNGNLTGTITDYYVGSSACLFSIVGTYSISTTASGTASTTNSSTDPNCAGSTSTVNLQLAQQGQSLVFAETDGLRLDTGSALKQ